MSITIKCINYTNIFDYLITVACRHALHAPSPATENQLYDLAKDLNNIARRIHTTGLADLLNRPLPPATSPEDPDLDLPDPDLDADADAEPVATNHQPPTSRQRPLASHQLRPRILEHISRHPGATAMEIATALDANYTTVAGQCKQLCELSQLHKQGQRPGRFHLHPPEPPTSGPDEH